MLKIVALGSAADSRKLMQRRALNLELSGFGEEGDRASPSSVRSVEVSLRRTDLHCTSVRHPPAARVRRNGGVLTLGTRYLVSKRAASHNHSARPTDFGGSS